MTTTEADASDKARELVIAFQKEIHGFDAASLTSPNRGITRLTAETEARDDLLSYIASLEAETGDIIAACRHCGYEGLNPHMVGPHHKSDCPRREDFVPLRTTRTEGEDIEVVAWDIDMGCGHTFLLRREDGPPESVHCGCQSEGAGERVRTVPLAALDAE